MTQITNFGFLGNDFQLKVLAQIMCDRTFGLNIIEILNPQYFDNKNYRQIASIIKNYNQKFDNSLPTMTGLKEQIIAGVKDEIEREYLITVVKELEKKSLEDDLATKETALNFCKQQELKKALSQVNLIIEKGDFERYDEIEEKIRKALAVVDRKDDSIEVLDDIDSVLEDDYRKPIPTGIDGLDEKIGGGLGKGELAIFLAPTGVGKSSVLTKVANTAYNYGYNVLQIFFEDSKKDIQRKHLTCWSGIALNDLSKAKDFVKQKALEHKKNGGKIILKKCPSDSTTVAHIKQYLRYLRNKGIQIDMLVLDYVDCISASKTSDDQTMNEGTVIRQIESLASEFNVALWLAAQSNRCLTLDTIVDTPDGKIEIGKIKTGDSVLTHKGYRKVEHVYPVTKQTVYKIKTKSGKEILCSAKHIFPTTDGYQNIEENTLVVGTKLLIKK